MNKVMTSITTLMILLGIVIFLSGCGSQLVVKEVKVPVPIPCKIISP